MRPWRHLMRVVRPRGTVHAGSVFVIIPNGEQVAPTEAYKSRDLAERVRSKLAIPSAYEVRKVRCYASQGADDGSL